MGAAKEPVLDEAPVSEIRGRALEALGAIGRGEGSRAEALLDELVSSGIEPARGAISEVKEGRWDRAVLVLFLVLYADVEENAHRSEMGDWARQVADLLRRQLHRPESIPKLTDPHHREIAEWTRQVAAALARERAARMFIDMVPREMLEKSGFDKAELDAAESAGLRLGEAVDRGVVKLPSYLRREQLPQYMKNLETIHEMGFTIEEWSRGLEDIVDEGTADDLRRMLESEKP